MAATSSRPVDRRRGKMFDPDAWRYFATFYRGSFLRLASLAVVSMLQSLLVLPVLYLIKQAFDVAIPGRDIRLLVLIGLAILAIRLIGTAISLSLRAAYLKIIKTAVTEIRESLLRKLYTLPRAFYTSIDRDQVHARLVQDTERIDHMSNVVVATAGPALLTSLVLALVLLVVSPVLLVTLLLLMPFAFLAAKKSGRSVKESVRQFQRAFESFSKGTLFVLQFMDLTRTQASEATEIDRQLGHMDRLRTTGESMAFRFAVHSQVQNTLTGIAIIVIVVVGGTAVIQGSMTLGEFLAFYVAAGLLNTYLNALAGSLPDIITGNESMATLHGLASTPPAQPYGGSRQIDFSGCITLDHVSFSYGEDPILEDVNLQIRPGRIVALIGPNGAGKSTIAHLILGFYRPSAGTLLADGVAYDDIDLGVLRRRIGIVTQHPELFSGTIAENLRYGNEGIDDAHVIEAAKTALVYEFVSELPEGFDTHIGADGVLLSGGQRQRLAIARALLRKPRLLIMDEPTNHLDSAAVARLITNIRGLQSSPAILLISHDPAVISVADHVYQLEGGELKSHVHPQLAEG